jgi:signal transduction histidine kinase/DNA-binding LacI/PurR family transcriptional regulator
MEPDHNGIHDSPRRGALRNQRPTIGFISGGMHTIHMIPFLHAAFDATAAEDVNLVFFPGRHLDPQDPSVMYTNSIYDLVGPENVDGLFANTSLLSSVAGIAGAESLYQRFAPLPLISTSLALEGVPSLVVDNRAGMRELVEHLLDVHGCRHVAFVPGPSTNEESRDRYQGYVDALAARGIPVDSALVAPSGNWGVPWGTAAARILLDDRRREFDAVACANDQIAWGVLGVLQERGIRVPDDVRVTGFDDSIELRHVEPAITTVRQSFYETTTRAIHMVLAMIRGESVPPKVVLPTSLVVKRSCGCEEQAVSRVAAASALSRARADFSMAFSGLRSQTLEECSARARHRTGPFPVGQGGLVLDAFAEEIRDPARGAFVKTLENVLLREGGEDKDLDDWNDLITLFRKRVLPHLSATEAPRAEDMLQQARVVIGETMRRVETRGAWRRIAQVRLLNEIESALIGTYDMERVRVLLDERLPALGVAGCSLALYVDPTHPAAESELLFACGSLSSRQTRAGVRFPSRELVPYGLLRRRERFILDVEALHYQDNLFGFVVFEMRSWDGEIYDFLRNELNGILHGALLMQSREEAARALEKAYQEVEKLVQERTAQLQVEISERTRAEEDVRRLNEGLEARIKERTAELEMFTYSISHDLRAPLRAIDGFTRILMADHAEILPEAVLNNLQRIGENVLKMTDLITGLLSFYRLSNQPMEWREIDTGALVREVAESLRTECEGREVDLRIGALPACMGDATLIRQVWVNLLSNSIKFTRGVPAARVEAEGGPEDDAILYCVRDNGAGFDMRYADKLFGFFQRLHTQEEFAGTGVGLATVKRIIQRHGGRIWAEAEPGKGATFSFTLPVTPPVG